MLNEQLAAAVLMGNYALGRVCGGCGLCCRLLPANELSKPANKNCSHYSRSSGGCRNYADRPNTCRIWACHWLLNPEFEHMRRPDKAHYVVDIIPDYITTVHDSGVTIQ